MLGDMLRMLKLWREASVCISEMLTDSWTGQGGQVIREDKKAKQRLGILWEKRLNKI